MKIIVENTVCLNTGDAAILMGIRKLLQESLAGPVEFVVFDSDPEVASRLYPKDRYPDLEFRKLLAETFTADLGQERSLRNRLRDKINRFKINALRGSSRIKSFGALFLTAEQRASLDEYKTAALAITTGGTYLVETYNLSKRFLQFEIDRQLDKSPVFFTQSLGPFNKPVNQSAMVSAMKASPLVLLRDQESLDNLKKISAHTNRCYVVADAAFALAETETILHRFSEASKPPRRVAISVRQWNYVNGGEAGMQRYMESIKSITTTLVRDHNIEVTFLSTCQGIPEYRYDDSRTAKEIVALLEADVAVRVSINSDFHTPFELMELVKSFDFVVSTRMHMMILSLCAGTPVLPIAYEFKTSELAKRVGVDDVLLNIDTMTPEESVAKLEDFIANLNSYRSASLEATLREHASAMSVAALLKRHVKADANWAEDNSYARRGA